MAIGGLGITRRLTLVLLMAATALVGCATAELSLSPTELRQIRIAEVKVVYHPKFHYVWEAAEEEFAAKQPAPAQPKRPKAISVGEGNEALAATAAAASARTELAQSPAGQEYVRNRIAGLIKGRAEKVLIPKFQGSRPVVIEVEVVTFMIPSAGQKIILGGSNRLGALTVLKDAGTGQVLGRMNRGTGTMTGRGVLGTIAEAAIADPPEIRLAVNYIEHVESWLNSKP